MTTRSEILTSNPIGKGLDSFRNTYASNSIDESVDNEGLKITILDLILALLGLPASRLLPSKRGDGNLLDDLLSLNLAVNRNNLDTARIRPLLDAVLDKQPDEVIWDAVYDAVTKSTPPPRPLSSTPQTPWLYNTSSFSNSNEYRKYVDDVLKEEPGAMYVGVPGFFEAFFGNVASLKPAAQAVFAKCKEGDNPLYREESGWQGWPEGARERDVLSWFAETTGKFVDLAREYQPDSRPRRRPLVQPHQPLQGSTADRKLDVGFVDDPSAGADSKYHWKQILVPGELKSNPSAETASKTWLDLGQYAREVLAAQDSRRFVLGFTLCGSRMRLWEFDRLGGIASSQFDINEDGLRFVSALGFDPSIITAGSSRYIEIERNNQRERLIIEEVIQRAPCIVGRATTCWKAYREGDESRKPLVIKDSWQFPEREEEGQLLCEATNKDVVNVARYYYHETVCVGGQDDNVRANVRQSLDTTRATNYMPESTLPPPSMAGRRVLRKGRSSSAVGQKRSSSCTEASLPPSKRTCSSSLVKGGRATADRVHRRVIVQDYGKPIYKASSKVSLLAALEGCIAGYESLHTRTNMLQCDISPNNLMVNEEEDNPSWHAFLIDLDLAIKENREKPSGAQGKTGTRAFMAIILLLGVFFWICIHYNGSQARVVQQFDKWNYANTEELAKLKLGTVSDDDIFRKTTLEHFTEYYQPLIPCVNRLRRKVFPVGRRWKDPNPKLYVEMKEILRTAQDELKGLE
ncbi:hypothetical protein BU25DRAFT_433900 [Macroventuria anomochaeta]|uniref:Uncharacterized protein n=1 Tax=Macroventuria anomochaeta TaxID=301207 RepID=A0ACB6RPG0_9PLEO|nr:uncharacterized protein BU25DRAFT_433900 [Macroventuria anomochaeta]KAF2623840.1 hypothetical protein BU25DRAFT_433900 [Macroventuria anomochaeta]